MGLTKEQRDWLALALVPGVGTAHFIRLLARFRTPRAVLNASRAELEEIVGRKLAQQIQQYGDVADVDGQLRAMEACGARLVTLEDPEYPPRLAEIYDPPLLLFVRGTLTDDDARCVAVVGTRRPTPYGVRMAEQFGRELAARDVTVVSGMANGIDAAAHRGALEAGGRTIAVLGSGVDVVYPPQNEDLYNAIQQNGCVVSQFPMGMKPIKGNFPYRNRIISGLTLGTLIVEAPARSGALITAKNAAEQGREVFAVPGQIGTRNAEGPHNLIREGAKLVANADDILVEIELPERDTAFPPVEDTEGVEAEPAAAEATTPPAPEAKPKARPSAEPPAKPANDRERRIMGALSPDGTFIDEIAARCKLSIAEALSALTLLELKGLVRQFSGKRFAPR